MGWLSIYQSAFYHSLLTLWKVLKYNVPVNNLRNYQEDRPNKGRIKTTKRIWSIRTKEMYERLPLEVTSCNKISVFKIKLRGWIKNNIALEEEE